jgi:hypothetical protein
VNRGAVIGLPPRGVNRWTISGVNPKAFSGVNPKAFSGVNRGIPAYASVTA